MYVAAIPIMKLKFELLFFVCLVKGAGRELEPVRIQENLKYPDKIIPDSYSGFRSVRDFTPLNNAKPCKFL
jgi:hypothetical protein